MFKNGPLVCSLKSDRTESRTRFPRILRSTVRPEPQPGYHCESLTRLLSTIRRARELLGLFYMPSLPLLYTTIQLELVFLPISTTEAQRRYTAQHLVWDQGAEHLRPSLSRGQRIEGELRASARFHMVGRHMAQPGVTQPLNPHHLPGGPGVPSPPASRQVRHHWSSVIHGFLISPPFLPLFQLLHICMYK